MIINEKNVMGSCRIIYWILIMIILFIPWSQTNGIDDWPSEAEFEVLGFNIQVHFNPEPGTISSNIDKIIG
ncbi:MAG: hypothetical protein JSW11_01190, partial [Candidatus Heimdallarchaeota archaeon]